MPLFNRPARTRRNRIVVSLILSALLLSGSGSHFAAFAQKAEPVPPSSERDFSRPRRIDLASENGKDGPVIRVALLMDVSSVTLGSSSGFTLLRSRKNNSDSEKLVNHPVRVELRQQLVRVASGAPAREPDLVANKNEYRDEYRNEYRVEVGSVSDMAEARKVTEELKKRFDEPASSIHDNQSSSFRILIGHFDSRSEAMSMIERLRHAGYTAARIAPDYAKEDQSPVKISKPPEKIAKSVKPSKKPASSNQVAVKSKSAKPHSSPPSKTSKPEQPQYQQITQMVAVEGERVIALAEDKLVALPATAPAEVETRESPKTQAQELSYLEKRKRDEQTLWGTGAKSNKDNSQLAGAPAPLIADSSRADSIIRVDDKYYRGEIHLKLNSRGRLNVINAVPLEQYLRGVVPVELSPGLYPAIEALKAQAVAARTYALARMNKSREADFDLRDDARSQVYGGISVEHEMTNRAIEQTRGVVALSAAEDGVDAPIEALYTANCGGQTENNEVIFGGAAMSYLRSVACAPDRLSIAERRIVSNLTMDSLVESEGRLMLRELALFQVLGFQLPRRATNSYLKGTPEADELQAWLDRASELSQKERLRSARSDSTRLPGFALAVASAIYGEGRAALMMTPADVDYILAGLEGKGMPADVRASIAALLKDGVLQPPAFDTSAQITRAFAIETFARAISFKSNRVESNAFKPQVARLRFDAARPSENGRLIIASSPAKPSAKAQEIALTKPKAADARPARSTTEMKSKEVIARPVAVKENALPKDLVPESKPDGFEVDKGAWLFRSFAGHSYPVDNLRLIGGEKITFHLNSAGRVDFLEAAAADHSASSDRYSSVAGWQERVTAEEVARRLARARVNVGQIESITPVAFSESNRVIEIEITGYEGSARLRGPKIRSAFGLKENLFVVDRETDATGRTVAFVFTGRGWGHGVGMCQTGAYGLAKEGYSYIAILQKYYTGVRVRKVY